VFYDKFITGKMTACDDIFQDWKLN